MLTLLVLQPWALLRAADVRGLATSSRGTTRLLVSGDEHWWDGIGDYSQAGLPEAASALALYGGDIYAAGGFGDNSRDLRSIARWDGSRWQPLEEGLLWGWPPPCPGGTCATWCAALAVHDGFLVAGGRFNYAGQYAEARRASNIARWDGNRWYNLGSGCNGVVTSLAVYRGELIASGYFTEAGGQPVNHIARWDGVSWRPLGGGLNAMAFELVEYRGDLVAVGGFDQAEGAPAKKVARWDGTSWHAFNDQYVDYNGAGVWRDTLFANVYHDQDGYQHLIVSRWNGTSWEPTPGGELGYSVYDYASYNDRLIATGDFYNGRPNQLRNIAQWDGTRWEAMGSGLGPEQFTPGTGGFALLVVGQSLYVTGDFLQAGGKTSWYIARWDDEPTPVVVEALRGRWVEGGIQLSWRFAPSSLPSIMAVHVERSSDALGPYADLTPQPLTARESMSFLDAAADAERCSWYRLRLLAREGSVAFAGPVEILPFGRELEFALEPPAVPTSGGPVLIRYRLGTAPGSVDLSIYDVRGRLVRCLESGPAMPGEHARFWDRRTGAGVEIPRGVYLVRLGVDARSATRKLPLGCRK